jgi:tetratricopeptide (TPR) repeat protein
LNPYAADARGVVGDSLLELGRYDGARRAFQKMVDLEPNVASLARVAYYREIAGDVPGAIAAMNGALRYAGTPEDVAWVSHQIGELHFHAGRLGAARTAHLRATSAVPGYLPARAALAEIVAAHGDFDRAGVLFERVMARKATPEYAGLLGDVYTRAGRTEAARAQYELAAELSDPSITGELNPDPGTALLHASLGDTESALEMAREVYAERPTVEAADALAWTLYRNGRYPAAARLSNESLRFGTKSAQFHFHAGMIQLRLGHEESAQKHLSTALDIHPNFSFVDALVAGRTTERLGAN